MGQNEIIAGNKLIAEFMGLKYWSDYGYFRDQYWENCVQLSDSELAIPYYESSWDWLMPVVDKIAKDYDFHLWSTNDFWACNIQRQNVDITENNLGDMGGAEPIYCVYKAVIQFITWYNKQPDYLKWKP